MLWHEHVWVAVVAMFDRHCFEWLRKGTTMASMSPDSFRIRGSGCQGVALGYTRHRNVSISQCGEERSGGLCESKPSWRWQPWADISTLSTSPSSTLSAPPRSRQISRFLKPKAGLTLMSTP